MGALRWCRFLGGRHQSSQCRGRLGTAFGGRNQIQVTPPGGLYGARGSRLIKLLTGNHYNAQLTAEELRHVAAWIDCNAVFYGAYRPDEQARQLRGESLAMPDLQ